jgi:hypothetical protein
VNFTGPDAVKLMEVEIRFGPDTIFKEPRDLSTGESIPIQFQVEKGQSGDVVVTVRSLSGALVSQENLGYVEYEEKEKETDYISAILIVIIIIFAGIFLVLGISWFIKPGKKEQGEDLEGIGAPTRYSPGRGPLGPERGAVRGGRMAREELPPRGGMRRAPPKPESRGPPPRGDGVRRAPPAPDHLRPGGRQREVRRAPPRR